MVNTYLPPNEFDSLCPTCGSAFQAPPSSTDRRIQCPICRELAEPDDLAGTDSTTIARTAPATSPTKDPSEAETIEKRIAALELAFIGEQRQVEALKTRVIMLESAVAGEDGADAKGEIQSAAGKFEWYGGSAYHLPDFSAEQGRVLAHNLRNVRKQRLTIRFAADDEPAQIHAKWFKTVFDFAGWEVRGPEAVPPDALSGKLELAVPELPVAEDAAKTYLALKAAGFNAVPVVDPTLTTTGGVASLSLTLPTADTA